MTLRIAVWLGAVFVALAFASAATAQSAAKKELVQKILQIQQTEIEGVARNLIERPAAQMMQEAGLALQRQVAPDKREAMGRAIEAEVKNYVDEAYPLVRERALRLAPSSSPIKVTPCVARPSSRISLTRVRTSTPLSVMSMISSSPRTSVAATTLPLRSDCWIAIIPLVPRPCRVYSAMPVRLP